jgi:hypothetical protein
MWHTLTGEMSKVPQDRDLRLAVIDAKGEVHALVFPSRYRAGRLGACNDRPRAPISADTLAGLDGKYANRQVRGSAAE